MRLKRPNEQSYHHDLLVSFHEATVNKEKAAELAQLAMRARKDADERYDSAQKALAKVVRRA